MLGELLRSRQDAIGHLWLELTLATYRSDAAGFMMAQKNPFANPVGQTLAKDLQALLNDLVNEAEPESVCTHLEEIIKIRAVQDFTPAEGVRFVFLLKDAIRDVLTAELADPDVQVELYDFDSRIDQVALFAFDIFAMCREKVYSLRLNEIRKGYVAPAG